MHHYSPVILQHGDCSGMKKSFHTSKSNTDLIECLIRWAESNHPSIYFPVPSLSLPINTSVLQDLSHSPILFFFSFSHLQTSFFFIHFFIHTTPFLSAPSQFLHLILQPTIACPYNGKTETSLSHTYTMPGFHIHRFLLPDNVGLQV